MLRELREEDYKKGHKREISRSRDRRLWTNIVVIETFTHGHSGEMYLHSDLLKMRLKIAELGVVENDRRETVHKTLCKAIISCCSLDLQSTGKKLHPQLLLAREQHCTQIAERSLTIQEVDSCMSFPKSTLISSSSYINTEIII